MGEEIQFETFAQNRVIDGADLSLPGGAGVGDHDIDAAEGAADLIEGAPDISFIGDVAPAPKPADCIGHSFGGDRVQIKHGRGSALGGEKFRRRRADAGAAAGDQRHLSGQGLRGALGGAFGLFRRPVFDVEQIGFGCRRVTADTRRIGNDLDIGFEQIGGDSGFPLRWPKTEQTQAGPAPPVETDPGARPCRPAGAGGGLHRLGNPWRRRPPPQIS